MDLLFWTYLVNAVFLINHEIDSAYWQEWKLISPGGALGIRGFLILHFPMLFAVLLGLVLVYEGKPAGMIMSLALSAGGLFAFVFHFYHLKKGKREFDTKLSKGIIVSTFVVSLFQMVLTVKRLAG